MNLAFAQIIHFLENRNVSIFVTLRFVLKNKSGKFFHIRKSTERFELFLKKWTNIVARVCHAKFWVKNKNGKVFYRGAHGKTYFYKILDSEEPNVAAFDYRIRFDFDFKIP